mgnify:CR=1 FL=1
MPSIGKFVIGNISTLQSASNIYVDPANYKYVHASSSNVELAFKNIDDKIESLEGSTISTSGNNTFTGTNTFSGKLTASNGLVVSNHFTADDGTVTVSGILTASAAASFASTVYAGGVLTAGGNIVPATDDAVDLGTSGAEFKDLYIDGVAYVDSLQATQLGAALDANSQAITNINVDGGAIDGTNIGANSRGTAAFTTLDANGNVILGSDVNDVITVNGEMTASQGMLIADDKKLFFGAGKDASFEYDEDGTDRLLYAGANLRISDDVKIEFGSDGDASIEYDENGTDELRFAGAAAKFEQKVTFEGDLTASQGFSLSGGSLVINKGRLGVDSNAGNTADSIMLFDNSDSDLAKTITISQLSSIITVEDANADYYAALTGSNTFTNTNTFAGDLTASQGMTSMGDINVNGTLSANTVSSMGSMTASNGLTVMGTDDGASLAIMTANTGSFFVSTKGTVSISSQNEDQAAFPIVLGNNTSVTGDLSTTGAITSSNGLTVTAPDSAKGVATALNVSHDGTVNIGVEDLAINVLGAATFFSSLTSSQGMKIRTDDSSTIPRLEVFNDGTGDAAIMWSVTGDSFAMGIDNGSSDRFKISYAATGSGATLGTNDILTINSSGYVGIGDNTPDTFLDVEGDPGANLIAAFKHTGGSVTDLGVKIQAGSATTGSLVTFYNGSGGSLGEIGFSSDTITYGTFTGAHYVSVPSASNESGYEYGALMSIQDISYAEGSRAVFYNCIPSTSPNDSSVLGVYSNKLVNSEWGGGENVHQVFSLGDGHILVCNEGGDITRGDYIASSNTTGHGMKQSDDLLHNYTIAKATESVVWANEAETTKLIACTYHCG